MVPSASARLSTSWLCTMSRVIESRSGTPSPRSMVRATALPFGPRIRSRAASTVSPSTEVPSTRVTTSPGFSPIRSAGEPGSGSVTTSRQAAPSGVQPSVPSSAFGRDLGADALELPADPLQALAIVVRRQVGRIRVPEGADHPPDGALDELVRVDRAARVPVGDRVVGVPERLEGGSSAMPASRARSRPVGRGCSPTRTAPTRRAGDQHHGDRGRARRRRFGGGGPRWRCAGPRWRCRPRRHLTDRGRLDQGRLGPCYVSCKCGVPKRRTAYIG